MWFLASFYRGAHIALIVYDVHSDQTLQNVETIWLKNFREQNEDAPAILLGNKIDLISNSNANSGNGHGISSNHNYI